MSKQIGLESGDSNAVACFCSVHRNRDERNLSPFITWLNSGKMWEGSEAKQDKGKWQMRWKYVRPMMDNLLTDVFESALCLLP
ncbi:hypothetical protein AXG93_209s1210 [Marchantia polymorpha subsp. ruderalis]|uniref:Uncharacterized protein n=1 Tax=Marchantia polymorpha subsp. ruderalis TaxID=1480154 RepID=A0A176VIW5_MARPO|nr:hypothetical protein AXG93_209s1210 [Marchantia polymorpha subsp. ruderalis]